MTTGTYDRLAEACDGRLSLGTSEDAVCGIVPSFVAAPGSVGDIAALLRIAGEFGLSVVPRGAGTKLHWGSAPVSCDLIMDMSRLDRVVDHTEGDMVVEVEAGCELGKLADILALRNQRLSVEIPGYDDDTHHPGTVGGLIATACAGARRLAQGTVRDLLLGVTMVRADGVVASSGGRVVKNVAGYDLGKLLTGSVGTLGIVVSATFRLHPEPEATAWVTTTAPDPRTAVARANALIDSQQEPATIDIDRPGNDEPITVLAGFEGTVAGAENRARHAAAALGGEAGAATGREPDGVAGPESVDVVPGTRDDRGAVAGPADDRGSEVVAEPPVWHGSWPDSPHGTLVEITVPPASLPSMLGVIAELAGGAGLDVPVRGSAGVGIVHAAAEPEAEPGAVASFVSMLQQRAAGFEGSVVVVHAPAAVRERVDMWGPVGEGALALMRRVKDQFDPGHLLSPGRFVGGI